MTNEKTVGTPTPPKKLEHELRHELMVRANHACEGSQQYPGCRIKVGEEYADTGRENKLLAILRMEPGTSEPAKMRVQCSRCFLSHDFAAHKTQNWREARDAKGNLEMFPIEPKS